MVSRNEDNSRLLKKGDFAGVNGDIPTGDSSNQNILPEHKGHTPQIQFRCISFWAFLLYAASLFLAN